MLCRLQDSTGCRSRPEPTSANTCPYRSYFLQPRTAPELVTSKAQQRSRLHASFTAATSCPYRGIMLASMKCSLVPFGLCLDGILYLIRPYSRCGQISIIVNHGIMALGNTCQMLTATTLGIIAMAAKLIHPPAQDHTYDLEHPLRFWLLVLSFSMHACTRTASQPRNTPLRSRLSIANPADSWPIICDIPCVFWIMGHSLARDDCQSFADFCLLLRQFPTRSPDNDGKCGNRP